MGHSLWGSRECSFPVGASIIEMFEVFKEGVEELTSNKNNGYKLLHGFLKSGACLYEPASEPNKYKNKNHLHVLSSIWK